MSQGLSHVTDQLYFIALALINKLHGLLPFVLRPVLYQLCRFDIDRSATLQGGIRFFHVGRLRVGEGTLVNRGVYLDNRGGITIAPANRTAWSSMCTAAPLTAKSGSCGSWPRV